MASASTQITLGNGSNDVLVLLAEAFLKPGLEAVYSQYAFAVYPIAIQATGATGSWRRALPAESDHAAGSRPVRHGARHHTAHARGVHCEP